MDRTEVTFEQIFTEYYPHICRYCAYRLKDDSHAEDIASEVFILLAQRWDSIEPHSTPVLATWLYRTARFKLQEHARHLKRRVPTASLDDPLILELRELAPLDPTTVNPETGEAYTYDEYITLIRESLSEDEFFLFTQIFVKERPTDEIAAELGISPGALYVRWHRIRRRLQRLLRGDG